MAQLKVPAPPDRKTILYSKFKGVDFSVDPSLVARDRSPYAINMVADVGGVPEKRPGWRTLKTGLSGRANGVYISDRLGLTALHYGTRIAILSYGFPGSWVLAETTVARDAISTMFGYVRGSTTYIFILDGASIWCFDSSKNTLTRIEDNATVPTTLISRSPSGGGTLLNPVNLLTPKRTERFLGTATDKDYRLASQGIDNGSVKAEIMNASGQMVVTTAFTVNNATGVVTFTTAPGVSPLTGVDNVWITYSKTTAGYLDRIRKCKVYSFFGLGGDNRLFLSGNPDYPARDWRSALDDPFYFPDTGYADVGTGLSAIMGYAKLGDSQVILKEESAEDASIFLRSASMVGGEASFTTKQGLAGIGAVSTRAIATLVDEPLMLTRRGVYALTSHNVTAERTLRNRSRFIDDELTKEPGLSGAMMVEWQGLCVVALNNRMYLLDGRQPKAYIDRSGDYVYECYHWDGIPARCLASDNGKLYFGTTDGRLCQMNSDIEGIYAYAPDRPEADRVYRYSDEGAPIRAVWSTRNDDDDALWLFKNLQKKGCLVSLKPYKLSGVKIYIRADGAGETLIKLAKMGIWDWTLVDFEFIDFDARGGPREVFLNKKIKRYKRLQIILVNDFPNSGFGVFAVAKTITTGNYSK